VLQHELLVAGGKEFTRSATLELDFIAGDEVAMSESGALNLLRGAVKDLTGNECTESSAHGIHRAFRNAVKLPGVLLIVDNVHSQTQVGLLLQDILDTNAAVIFTSRSKEPLGGSAYVDVWLQVCCLLACCLAA
jgi:hypothetical protein